MPRNNIHRHRRHPVTAWRCVRLRRWREVAGARSRPKTGRAREEDETGDPNLEKFDRVRHCHVGHVLVHGVHRVPLHHREVTVGLARSRVHRRSQACDVHATVRGSRDRTDRVHDPARRARSRGAERRARRRRWARRLGLRAVREGDIMLGSWNPVRSSFISIVVPWYLARPLARGRQTFCRMFCSGSACFRSTTHAAFVGMRLTRRRTPCRR